MIKKFGYPVSEIGMCFGITGMKIQADLCEQGVVTFNRRKKYLVDFMNKYKEFAPSMVLQCVQSIERKRVSLIRSYRMELLKFLKMDINEIPNIVSNEKEFYKIIESKDASDLIKEEIKNIIKK